MYYVPPSPLSDVDNLDAAGMLAAVHRAYSEIPGVQSTPFNDRGEGWRFVTPRLDGFVDALFSSIDFDLDLQAEGVRLDATAWVNYRMDNDLDLGYWVCLGALSSGIQATETGFVIAIDAIESDYFFKRRAKYGRLVPRGETWPEVDDIGFWSRASRFVAGLLGRP